MRADERQIASSLTGALSKRSSRLVIEPALLDFIPITKRNDPLQATMLNLDVTFGREGRRHGGKAGSAVGCRGGRFWHITDIEKVPSDVRFWDHFGR